MSKVVFNNSKAPYEKAIKLQAEAYQNRLYIHKEQALKEIVYIQ